MSEHRCLKPQNPLVRPQAFNMRLRAQGLGKTITALALVLKTRGLEPELTGVDVCRRQDGSGRDVAFYTGERHLFGKLDAALISSNDEPAHKAQPPCAGESKNVLLSPTVSRRLSGIAPEHAEGSAPDPPPRQRSVPCSGSIGKADATAASTVHVASHEVAPAVTSQPDSPRQIEQLQQGIAADSLPNGTAAPLDVEEEPAHPPKRRRLSRSRKPSVSAVPEHHQLGNTAKTVDVRDCLKDKLFSDGAAEVERVQWVQCDRCGKWRLLDPDYKVSTRSTAGLLGELS